ncbi:MAG: hypothetical protein HZC37_19175 [Burkholderiales bacterium]|nr:hypothetical protein [Burkholderiales bacterium]
MQFDAWLNKAWDEHAAQPAGVAARIGGEGLPLARTDAHVAALIRLANHVCGEHLGRWDEGRQLIFQLGTSDHAGSAAGVAQRIFDASLALAGGLADTRGAMVASERIRVGAHAAGALAERDAPRAASLLREAALEVDTEALPNSDPACRAIAINGNDIAMTLSEKLLRSDAERDLMLLGARIARDYWARAGTWLEVERAEYRLAISWLKAPDLAAARRHARKCLDLVREHEAPALEWFFGFEALARVERALGNGPAAQRAVQDMKAAFERLDEGDREWCRPSLEKLSRLAPAAGGR